MQVDYASDHSYARQAASGYVAWKRDRIALITSIRPNVDAYADCNFIGALFSARIDIRGVLPPRKSSKFAQPNRRVGSRIAGCRCHAIRFASGFRNAGPRGHTCTAADSGAVAPRGCIDGLFCLGPSKQAAFAPCSSNHDRTEYSVGVHRVRRDRRLDVAASGKLVSGLLSKSRFHVAFSRFSLASSHSHSRASIVDFAAAWS